MVDKAVRTLGAVALAAALVIATGPAGAAGTARPAIPEQPGTTAAHGKQVKLITGDTVTVSADGKRSTIQPGKGRERLTFESFRAHDHLYVIPSDAALLVAGDRLDRRLFDVTGLIEDGYAKGASTPVLVSYADGVRRPSAGVRKTRDLPAINGMAAKADQQSVTWNSLKPGAKSGVGKLWLDGKRRVVLDQSVPQIGGPDAWAAGFTGKGVTVAVLDTGIDGEHPDLAGQVKAAKNFTDGPAGDGFGHGTHVASIIAGTAKASDGKYKGVAFDAQLLDGKVCDNGGSCTDSAILAGMEWAAKDQKADVINLSLGGTDTPEIDPLEEAVNTLTEQTGSLFVIAAGNEGPGGHGRQPRQRGRRADRRSGRQEGPDRRLLQPWPAGWRRRPEAGRHRARRRHRGGQGQGHRARGAGRRALRHAVGHLDGHSAHRGCGRPAGPAAPGLEGHTAQVGADGLRQAQPRADRVRPGCRPDRPDQGDQAVGRERAGRHLVRTAAVAAQRRHAGGQGADVPQPR
ncbi:hypothetical protein GCM10027569_51920 [Flindersiella endophytica]